MSDENLSFGIDSSAAKTGADEFERAMGRIATSAGAGGKAVDRFDVASQEAASSLRRSIGGLATIAGEAFAVHKVIEYADSMTRLRGQLSIVVAGTEQLTVVQDKLFNVAQNTRQSFESVGELYARVARSTKELHLSQTQLIDTTETIGRAVLISNVSTSTAQAGMYQLSQAFAAGRLQGQDFKAVIEDIPRLGQAIAQGLGVTIGKLREMSAAGEITSTKIIDALHKSNSALVAEQAKMQATVGQSFVVLENSIMRYIGQVNQSTGATNKLSSGIQFAAHHIDELAVAGQAIAVVYGVRWLSGATQSVAAYSGQLSISRAESAAYVENTVRVAAAKAEEAAQTLAATQARRAELVVMQAEIASLREESVARVQAAEARLSAAVAPTSLAPLGGAVVAAEQAAQNAALRERTVALIAGNNAAAQGVVVESELAVAEAAGTRQTIAAAAAQTAQAEALAATSLAARFGAAAVSTLNNVLAPLGGPIGVAVIAAIFTVRHAFEEEGKAARQAADDARHYADSLTKLNDAQLETQKVALETSIKMVEAQKASVLAKYSDLAAPGSANYDIGTSVEQRNVIVAQINAITASESALQAMLKSTNAALAPRTAAVAEEESRKKQAYDALKSQREDELGKQNALNAAYGRSAQELREIELRYDAQKEVAKNAVGHSKEQTAALNELTNAIANARIAHERLEAQQRRFDAARDAANANEAMIRESRQAYELTQVQGAAVDRLRVAFEAHNKELEANIDLQKQLQHASAEDAKAALTMYIQRIQAIEAERSWKNAALDTTDAIRKQSDAIKEFNETAQRQRTVLEQSKRETEAISKASEDWLHVYEAYQTASRAASRTIADGTLDAIKQFSISGTKSFSGFFDSVEQMSVRFTERIGKDIDRLADQLDKASKLPDDLGLTRTIQDEISHARELQQVLRNTATLVAGGIAGYNLGYSSGNSAIGAGGGFIAGAASGAQIGSAMGPWGAAIGGLVGAAGGLLGAAQAHKEAAAAIRAATEAAKGKEADFIDNGQNTILEQHHQLNVAYENLFSTLWQQWKKGEITFSEYETRYIPLHEAYQRQYSQIATDFWTSIGTQLNALDGPAGEYANKLAELKKQYDDNVASANALHATEAQRAQVDDLYAKQKAQADKAYEESVRRQKEDLSVRVAAATSTSYEVEQMKEAIARRRELADATDAAARADIAAAQAADLIVEARERQRMIDQTNASLAVRAAKALGNDDQAALIQEQIDNTNELYDAQQKGLDDATIANIKYVEGLEVVSLAAAQAQAALERTINGIKEEAGIFGYGDQTTLDMEAAAYGFAGKTIQDILSLYVKHDHTLTDAENTLNKNIAAYYDDYKRIHGGAIGAGAANPSIANANQVTKDVMALTESTGSRIGDYLNSINLHVASIDRRGDLLFGDSGGSRYGGAVAALTPATFGGTTVHVEFKGDVYLNGTREAAVKQLGADVARQVNAQLGPQLERERLKLSPRRSN
jgi:tape measure domain-containing protein